MSPKLPKLLAGSSLSYELRACAKCSFCQDNLAACPVFHSLRDELYSPRGRLILTNAIQRGQLNSKEALEALRDSVFTCSFCAACSEVCQTNIPLIHIWEELRKELGEQGLLPEKVDALVKAIHETNNVFSLSQEDRELWSDMVDDIYEDHVGIPAEIGYFVGCIPSYSGRLSVVACSFLSILDGLGIDFTVFSPTEHCCGNPLNMAGDPDGVRKLAEHNINEVEKLGIKKLVTTCPGCYRTFRNEYPRLLDRSLPFEVVHHTEFLFSQLEQKLSSPETSSLNIDEKKVTVAFKDPCELGRHCGVYEAPREIIELLPGVEKKEFHLSRENAYCCGGGGLLSLGNAEVAKSVTATFIQSLEELDVDICLTACPTCQRIIQEALQEKQSTIKVKDLGTFVAERLGFE